MTEKTTDARFRGPITKFCTKIEHVGSRVTCDPAPTDTDDDWLVCVPFANSHMFERALIDDGWASSGKYRGENEKFVSWKKGQLNIIATNDKDWFDKFMKATGVCKKLNLLKKDDRIVVFEAIVGD